MEENDETISASPPPNSALILPLMKKSLDTPLFVSKRKSFTKLKKNKFTAKYKAFLFTLKSIYKGLISN